MDLEQYIFEGFPDGLSYNEAAQLCLRLYCTVDGIPKQLHPKCTKDNLAEVFASLARRGFLTTPPLLAALYGANFHEVTEKGHWVEVIASIFKKGDTRDIAFGEPLVERLTKQWSRRDES
jgi:hypothetical protein